MTMPEEIFHSQFGKDTCTELVKTVGGRKKVQAAIDRYYPMMPAFFGKKDSENNALYRRCGIKQHTNEEMRRDYIGRARRSGRGPSQIEAARDRRSRVTGEAASLPIASFPGGDGAGPLVCVAAEPP